MAVNVNQLTGIAAKRELPVIWKVTKGFFANKAIIIPAALLISYFFPVLITVLLLIGGAYLAFEGMEKVIHHLKSTVKSADSSDSVVAHQSTEYSKDEERTKIRGAIRTDFILSAEIIIIAMGVVAHMDFMTKSLVMVSIGVGITIFVYGFVALIVKLDDMGLWLMQKDSSVLQKLGSRMIAFMPTLMRSLAIVGTIAMFLVGGGIFTHNWPWLHGVVDGLLGDSFLAVMFIDLVVGMLVGLAVYLVLIPFINLKRVEVTHLEIDA